MWQCTQKITAWAYCFPGGASGKEPPACQCWRFGFYPFRDGDSLENLPRDSGFPGLGRCPGESNVSPLQNSCLENPMDRGACHEVAKSQTWLKWLNTADLTLLTAPGHTSSIKLKAVRCHSCREAGQGTGERIPDQLLTPSLLFLRSSEWFPAEQRCLLPDVWSGGKSSLWTV